MKRYRLYNFDFDSRASVLNLEIKEEWKEETKRLHRENKIKIEEMFIEEYGKLNWDQKVKNIKDLGSKPISIVAFHNRFFNQIRSSFIIGSYYPALTGACALGERILNHLIFALKEDFRNTPEYKKVYNIESIDDWDEMLDILEKWKILLPDVISNYRLLKNIRNKKAIHFDKETDTEDRKLALEAIKLLAMIITGQFSYAGYQPWFIENTRGSFYIKKNWEDKPFIKRIYLPNCRLVGPYHKLGTNFEVIDNYPYTDKEITDAEFVRLMEQARQGIFLK
ncbi:MAG: hypothetical protein M1484_04075 [Patescibacteria group bacterium]|nr:hypothetical protein [Patescibacteria group bacterium]MCL5432236.1 hypothetical protein [Patescibacteria group bacterium]